MKKSGLLCLLLIIFIGDALCQKFPNIFVIECSTNEATDKLKYCFGFKRKGINGVLTAKHCICDCKTVKLISEYGGEKFEFRIDESYLQASPYSDLARLLNLKQIIYSESFPDELKSLGERFSEYLNGNIGGYVHKSLNINKGIHVLNLEYQNGLENEIFFFLTETNPIENLYSYNTLVDQYKTFVGNDKQYFSMLHYVDSRHKFYKIESSDKFGKGYSGAPIFLRTENENHLLGLISAGYATKSKNKADSRYYVYAVQLDSIPKFKTDERTCPSNTIEKNFISYLNDFKFKGNSYLLRKSLAPLSDSLVKILANSRCKGLGKKQKLKEALIGNEKRSMEDFLSLEGNRNDLLEFYTVLASVENNQVEPLYTKFNLENKLAPKKALDLTTYFLKELDKKKDIPSTIYDRISKLEGCPIYFEDLFQYVGAKNYIQSIKKSSLDSSKNIVDTIRKYENFIRFMSNVTSKIEYTIPYLDKEKSEANEMNVKVIKKTVEGYNSYTNSLQSELNTYSNKYFKQGLAKLSSRFDELLNKDCDDINDEIDLQNLKIKYEELFKLASNLNNDIVQKEIKAKIIEIKKKLQKCSDNGSSRFKSMYSSIKHFYLEFGVDSIDVNTDESVITVIPTILKRRPGKFGFDERAGSYNLGKSVDENTRESIKHLAEIIENLDDSLRREGIEYEKSIVIAGMSDGNGFSRNYKALEDIELKNALADTNYFKTDVDCYSFLFYQEGLQEVVFKDLEFNQKDSESLKDNLKLALDRANKTKLLLTKNLIFDDIRLIAANTFSLGKVCRRTEVQIQYKLKK